jgi:L-glyceraldehyde 3-phosphate reductase
MNYRRCGKSGLLFPEISLGLWHNFGHVNDFENGRRILRTAFDAGITHFDLANNYGPPYGAAEENFGKYMQQDFLSYRDELIISSKAGYDMWDGPYGNWGSKKYLVASLNQSLKRMNLEYVDIFYHHRPDPNTPLEETMHALDLIVRQGKALYVGISNYNHTDTEKAAAMLKSLGTPFIINQIKYSMFEPWCEEHLIQTASHQGIGLIAFSPLAEGVLTDRYLNGIPDGSRASMTYGHLKKEHITEERLKKVKLLNELAKSRGQKLAQMAIAWLLRHPVLCSVLIGASSVDQLKNNLEALKNTSFTPEELITINNILK